MTVHLSNNNSVQLNTKFEMETEFATLFLNYMETKFAILFLNYRKKLNVLSVLEIELHYEWIYIFSFESPMGNDRWKLNQLRLTAHFSISWTATLILTTGKTKHFLFINASKMASKMPQKCNFYFKMLLKCFEIDSKCNSTLKMLLKGSKNAALFPICFK